MLVYFTAHATLCYPANRGPSIFLDKSRKMLAGKRDAGSSMHLNVDETGKMVSFVYKFVSRGRQYRGCAKCHAHKKRFAMTKLESGRKSKIIMLVSSGHSLKVLNQYFFNLFSSTRSSSSFVHHVRSAGTVLFITYAMDMFKAITSYRNGQSQQHHSGILKFHSVLKWSLSFIYSFT